MVSSYWILKQMKACFSSLSKRLPIGIVSFCSHISSENKIKIEEEGKVVRVEKKEEKKMRKDEEIESLDTRTKDKINNVAIVSKENKKDSRRSLAVLRSNNNKKQRKLTLLRNAFSFKITKTCLLSNLKDFRSIRWLTSLNKRRYSKTSISFVSKLLFLLWVRYLNWSLKLDQSISFILIKNHLQTQRKKKLFNCCLLKTFNSRNQ